MTDDDRRLFGWQPCGYGCGRPWRPFAGTKLKGHALCAISPHVQDEILIEVEHAPSTTQKAIAERYGVTVSVVRAWLNNALIRRRARADAAGVIPLRGSR